MLAERLGSYSMAVTLAAISTLLRLKSITLYFLLWPPPIWREVIRPLLFLPPDLVNFLTRLFSGSFLESSVLIMEMWFRFPGDVGLYVLIAICNPDNFHYCNSYPMAGSICLLSPESCPAVNRLTGQLFQRSLTTLQEN